MCFPLHNTTIKTYLLNKLYRYLLQQRIIIELNLITNQQLVRVPEIETPISPSTYLRKEFEILQKAFLAKSFNIDNMLYVFLDRMGTIFISGMIHIC